jgi:hypothetical protein
MPFVSITMNASSVNAQQSMLVGGVVSPATMLGFAHYLQRATGIKVDAVLPVVHQFHLHIGHPKFRPTTAKECQKRSVSTLDILTADSRITLVLKLPDQDLEDDCTSAFAPYITRFAGGHVVVPPRIVFFETLSELLNGMRRLPAGWLICDRSDLFDGVDDPLDRLLDGIQRYRGGEGADDDNGLPRNLVPLHVGYVAIETPKQRHDLLRNPADGYDHVLAEPITTLAQFRFLHSALKTETPLQGCFWSYAPPNGRVLRVVGN